MTHLGDVFVGLGANGDNDGDNDGGGGGGVFITQPPTELPAIPAAGTASAAATATAASTAAHRRLCVQERRRLHDARRIEAIVELIAAKRLRGKKRGAWADRHGVGDGGSSSERARDIRAQQWGVHTVVAAFMAAAARLMNLRKSRHTFTVLMVPLLRKLVARVRAERRRKDALAAAESDVASARHRAAFDRHRLFSRLPAKQRDELWAGSLLSAHTAGEAVCHQGEPLLVTYIVLGGRVSVTACAKAQRAVGTHKGRLPVQQLMTLQKGESFGEFSILGTGGQPATLRAVDDCLLLVVPARAYAAAAASLPEEATQALAAVVCGLYRDLLTQHFSLTVSDLQSATVFRDVPEPDLLASLGSWRLDVSLPQAVIRRRGRKPQACYYLGSGQLQVLCADGTVEQTLHPGTVFGDEDLLMLQTNPHDVVSAAVCTIWCLSKADFHDLLLPHPAVLYAYCSHLNDRAAARMVRPTPDLLVQLPPFAQLPPRSLKALAGRLQPRVYGPGELATQTGQTVHHLILVVKGRLDAASGQSGGRNKGCKGLGGVGGGGGSGGGAAACLTLLGYAEVAAGDSGARWETAHKAAGRCFAWTVPAHTVRALCSLASPSDAAACELLLPTQSQQQQRCGDGGATERSTPGSKARCRWLGLRSGGGGVCVTPAQPDLLEVAAAAVAASAAPRPLPALRGALRKIQALRDLGSRVYNPDTGRILDHTVADRHQLTEREAELLEQGLKEKISQLQALRAEAETRQNQVVRAVSVEPMVLAD